jgi:hypothetical protein
MPQLREPDSPLLEGFETAPSQLASELGGLSLQSADVRIHLSADGVDALAGQDGMAELLHNMGEFVADNGHYWLDNTTKRQQGLAVTHVQTRSQLYEPLGLPEDTIVKAYAPDTKDAADLQFSTMDWLHHRLANAAHPDIQLSSPAQYALVESAKTGQKNIVMAKAAGEQLQGVSRRLPLPEAKTMIDQNLQPRILQGLKATLGRDTLRLTDVKSHLSNFILDGELNDVQPKVAIIDQPSVDTAANRLNAKMRHTASKFGR